MTEDLLTRLRAIDTTSLIDGSGAAGTELRVLPLDLRPVGTAREITGRVVTATAEQDLMAVIAALAACGPGDVLVIDAGGDDRAVAGELFATEALRRGVTGLVIFGRCRDSATLATLPLPVFARGFAPNAYPARRVPVVNEPLTLDGVPAHPGELLRGDADGLVVGSVEQMSATLDAGEAVRDRELRLRAAVEGGRSLFDALNFDDHVAALRAGRPSRLIISDLDDV